MFHCSPPHNPTAGLDARGGIFDVLGASARPAAALALDDRPTSRTDTDAGRMSANANHDVATRILALERERQYLRTLEVHRQRLGRPSPLGLPHLPPAAAAAGPPTLAGRGADRTADLPHPPPAAAAENDLGLLALEAGARAAELRARACAAEAAAEEARLEAADAQLQRLRAMRRRAELMQARADEAQRGLELAQRELAVAEAQLERLAEWRRAEGAKVADASLPPARSPSACEQSVPVLKRKFSVDSDIIPAPKRAATGELLQKQQGQALEDAKEVGFLPEDAPRRPLSAYNLFFSEERERIIQALQDPECKLQSDGSPDLSCLDELLAKHSRLATEECDAEADPTNGTRRMLERRRSGEKKARRRHRKSHGKIGFKDLVKVVGERWRNLPTDRVQHYKRLAAMDSARYRADMANYEGKKASLGLPPVKGTKR